MTQVAERVYGWDDTIQNDGGEFTLLPEGEYPFVVKQFERARHEGSAKLPACPKAIIHCEVDGGPLGKTRIKNNLFLHSKCEGLLCAFFLSVGMRKHGEPFNMATAWANLVGKRGRVRVGLRNGEGQYADKQYNEIKAFLEPTGNTTPAPDPATPVAEAEAEADLF